VALGYTGRPIDEKTGLSDFRARWYDANVGRFINEDPSGLTAKWAGYGGKGSVPAAGWGAYGAGTLLTSGAGNSTPTPFAMARAKSSPSYESPVWSGTKAFFGSISDSIVGGVTGLVTGEAGRQLGERAFQITVNNNGGKFNGQWGQVAYNIAGQMAGTHAMAEGMVGIDLASHEAVAAEDRVGRFAGGLGQFAGIAAGGAGMARSAAGVGNFTNLPGSAAVSRVSSSRNSAAARVWSRVDDAAGAGNNMSVSVVDEARIVRNSLQGELGEAVVRQRLLNSRSVDLVGEQIRINTPGVGSHRVVDFLVRGKNTGQLRIIEVKTGGATRDALQIAKDRLIADPASPTTFSGRRANAAGYPDGTPTGPIRTFEVNASSLKRQIP
jgi:hypothetical protein